MPLTEENKRDWYHVRQLDLVRALLIEKQVDIGISHDWPRGVAEQGNLTELFKYKSYFEPDVKVFQQIKSGKFGNPAMSTALEHLQPYFRYHLAKFGSQVIAT